MNYNTSDWKKFKYLTVKTHQTVPAEDASGKEYINQGTGVLFCKYNKTYLLTAAHCAIKFDTCGLYAEYPLDNDGKIITLNAKKKITTIEFTEGCSEDYAVFEIDNPNNGKVVEGTLTLSDLNEDNENADFMSYGYPAVANDGRPFDLTYVGNNCWNIDVRRSDNRYFKNMIEGLSGGGVFTIRDEIVECVSILKCTRDNQGGLNDAYGTPASKFLIAIDNCNQHGIIAQTNAVEIMDVDDYIPRYCTPNKGSDFLLYLHDEAPRHTLTEYVLGSVPQSDSLRYMLLSAPQSGKSYELLHTAHMLQAMDDEILVTFSKIGDVNFNIKGAFPNTDELQSGYKHVVIIDGLDEAQQRNLNDVVDSIRLFAKEYPTIPIVLSCREGFEMDERLKMFKPLYFEELTMKDVSDYFEASKMNSPRLVKFIRENQEAQELCKTPLGLQNFMNIYLRRHKMPRNKVELYESVIAARKIQMRERPSDAQESLFTNAQMALQRLAIVMMITDSQYLMPEDALKVFDNDESKLNNATYYYNKIFYKNQDGVYVFANNAMKETFAAKYLSSKTLDEVKHLSCFVDTDQIKPQWANVILMWLQGMENTSNAIDKDVIQWLSSSARDLLVQCDSSCIDAKARFNLFVEIMAKCRHENEMYSAFYTGDFKRLFNFAYQSNYALENYLMQEIVVADEPSYNLYNIYSLCTYIDWDKLRANNVSLYETFTSILMNSIEVYGDKGNFCACYFFFCNNCHFYGDVKYVKQLYSVVKGFKNREAHNALCISIGNGNHSDEYTEYLLTLLPMFKSSEYEFVSCSELYNALSKVKCPSNIIHVLESVTDREFVRKEYSTDDYQKMMVSLLGNSVIAYQDGNVEIANEVTASFHRLYGEYYFTNRSILHLLNEYEVFYTTTGFEDEEVKSLISKIRNFGKVDPEERQNRKLNHERCLKELCEYGVFKKRVLNILEQCPDVSDGIPPISFSSEVGYEHYVQDFFIQYSGLRHFSKASVLSAINSQQTYENFRFIAITRTLVQQSSFVNVGETQKHICRDFGRNILQSFIRKESSPKQNVLETAIQLLVIGIIKLDRQQLLSLMPYSYLNVILPSIQHVGNQASKSLFEFMTEKIGKRAFCKVAIDWLKRRKELQEPTVLSLCSFLIQYGKLDCLEAVYDCMSHYAGKPIFDLIMGCFLREKKHINRILHDIVVVRFFRPVWSVFKRLCGSGVDPFWGYPQKGLCCRC